LKHRPPLGPCRPLDQAPAVEIGRGLWSAAPSSSSGGHGSAARRRAGSSASARRPSRIPETFLELSPSVLGERVCWPEETAPRRPASCLDLERCVPPAVSPSTPPPPPPGLPPQQVAPLVSPCAPAVAATPPRVPFGERQVGAPLLVAWALFVSCLVMRAGGVAGCGGGSLDQRDGSNQLPAARGGAPACGGGRGREGLVDGGGRYFRYRPPLGPRKLSDQTPVAQIGPGLRSTTRSFRSARERATRRCSVAGAGACRRSRTRDSSPHQRSRLEGARGK